MVIRTEPVTSVMTRDVLAVPVDAAPSEVRALLRKHTFHHVPVVKGDVVVGILSTVDLAKVSLEAWGVDTPTDDATLDASYELDALMSHDVECLHVEDTVYKATERLADGNFHALPVVDDERRLVGVVTSTDLLRYLYRAF